MLAASSEDGRDICAASIRRWTLAAMLARRTTLSRPLEQLPDQRRDPALRRQHFVHDGKMVGAGDFLDRSPAGRICARWPAKSAVCLRSSGSSALPTTSDSGFIAPPACVIGELRCDIGLVELELDVEIAVADRLEIVDADDRHARFHLRMRQRHRGQMAAGRPAGYHDAVGRGAERGQLPGEIIDARHGFRRRSHPASHPAPACSRSARH